MFAQERRLGKKRERVAGKKIKERKRHVVTDVTGFPLAIQIQPADTQDRDGALGVIQMAYSISISKQILGTRPSWPLSQMF
ncbi:MAG: hypothetical protein KBF11_06775 [Desulfomicrobium sp.]|nr:hypothetical protein [Desulfomicrobium sp.]